jgi:transposase
LIKNGEFFVIKDMKQRGMTITQISNELGRDRKTIRKWLKEPEATSYTRKSSIGCILDPFKTYIRQRMQEGCLNATVLLDEIKEQGYPGGITTLRLFMNPIRPTVVSKATERFETPPGKQAQVDWGTFRVDWMGQKKRIYAFVMVLGYSRMMYVEFTEDEKLETLMGCHTRAIEYFGGITETCLYDNMKTVVIGQDERGQVIWNERFARFATHHGFILQRCRPYRARTKGKVENGVSYIRKNFWPRIRTFTGLNDLNQQVRHWLDTVANVRIHGTTHEMPSTRLQKETLKRANPTPYEYVERHIRKVSNDSLVSYQGNRYSVPFQYIGYLIHIQDEKNGTLRFFYDNTLITEHVKAYDGRYQVSVNKKHFEGIRKTNGQMVPQPLPRLVSDSTPEVIQRPLSVYEALTDEEVKLQ